MIFVINSHDKFLLWRWLIKFYLNIFYPHLTFSWAADDRDRAAVVGQEVPALGPHRDQLRVEVTDAAQIDQGMIT